jgi:putative ATP-dependent endonuclease of OLD family
MRIRRLTIKNFRNFQALAVDLADHAVFVGPNGAGKSNLLHALRLLLDPSLPDSMRQLRPEDFWDGIMRPLPAGARIDISVELTDFEANDDQLASLAEHLVETAPMVARLTYVFRAKAAATPPLTSDDFEFFVFGGDREDNRVGYEIRRRLPADFFHALRDAEGDLASWRRSPLRPLLERAWANVPKADKDGLAKGIDELPGTVAVPPRDARKAQGHRRELLTAGNTGATGAGAEFHCTGHSFRRQRCSTLTRCSPRSSSAW